MPIKSFLKQTLKNLPEGSSMKAESVKPMLLKKGVKQEELDYSGFDVPGTGRVTKEQLMGIEEKRSDKFYVTEMPNNDYQSVSLPDGQNNPTYREKVLQFSERGNTAKSLTSENVLSAVTRLNNAAANGTYKAERHALMQEYNIQDENVFDIIHDLQEDAVNHRWGADDGSRYTSSHFPDVENYLAHTRIYDTDLGGTPTRVLQEIQSDLHQQGRRAGYADAGTQGRYVTAEQQAEVQSLLDSYRVADDTLENADEITEEIHNSFEEAEDALENYLNRIDPTWREEAGEVVEAAERMVEGDWTIYGAEGEALVPKSPYEKTWLTKSIERELDDAISEGRQQLAIPISGEGVSNLQRAEGVQKWYETQVLNTAKKIAQRNGMDFEVVSHSDAPSLNVPPELVAKVKNLFVNVQEGDVYALRDANMAALELIRKELPAVAEMSSQEIPLENTLLHYIRTDKLDEFVSRSASGTQYAVIKPKAGMRPDFTLYSAPTAAGFAAYMAYKEGYNDEQVATKLMEQGYDEEEIADINEMAKKIATAEAAGYSKQEIEQYLQGKEIVADTKQSEPYNPFNDPAKDKPGLGVPRRLYKDTRQEAFDSLMNKDVQDAKSLVTALQTVKPVMTSDMMTTIPAYFGNKEAFQRYDAARLASRQEIIRIAKEQYGIELLWQGTDVGSEGWYVQDPNNPEGVVEVTPGFWDDLKSTKGELALGIAGGIAGFKMAPKNPYAKAIGSTLGAIAGAAAGSQIDYLAAAIETNQEMEAEVAAYRAMNAAELAAVGEAVGYSVVKTLGAAWKGVVRAKDMVIDGNTQGAYQALKETMFMSDDQIDEIVENFERLNGPLKGNKAQKAIQAVTLSEKGMQDLVRVAGAIDPKASRAVVKTIDDRAADLLKTTGDLTTPETARVYIKDLKNYTADVKEFYNDVKMRATQSPRGLNFNWDYDKLAIEPVLDHLSSKITDPVTSQKFLLQAERIRSFSGTRSFGDLIEFRQIVNDFLFNKRITKADDKRMLRSVIQNIDEAIKEGAPQVVENPKQWLDDWATARTKYTEMKKVEQTAMYKMVFDKNGNVRAVQPETVIKGLTKYMGALDGSFEEVMEKLPKGARGKYEAAAIDHLTNTYTAGVKGGMRATNFPMLADELAKINFTAPEARAAKKMIEEMATVFKNDVYLAQASGKIEIPKFQSYLTTDPVVRAKFEIASGIFNYIKTWAPGDTQRNFALVRQAARLLEEPLNAQASKELLMKFSGDVNMTDAIVKMQREAAKAKAAGKDLGSAKYLLDDNGKFVHSVSAATKKIPMHRVASEETVKLIADRESITVDNKNLDKILKQYGYVAVAQGSDRVRMLGGK